MQKKTLALAVSALFAAPSLHAAPEGGHVAAGRATIVRQGGDTRITQDSQRAIINWKSFDIGKTEKVEHAMPSTASYGLHRVTGGGGASQLAGELKSNGNVFLVNPAGVVIHKGARIDVGGFLASTADIRNEDFMAGNLLFNQPGNPGAAILNLGNISVSDRGFAALVAPVVRNDGIIAARLGRITLAAGEGFKLDFYGDDLIAFAAPEPLVDGLYTPEGETLGVTNNGEIKAEGGIVYLTASQLDAIVQSVVQNGGTVSAASAEMDGGKIVLKAEGERIDLVNTGTLVASGEAGGEIRLAGEGRVSVSGEIDARGKTTGGQIDISGKAGTTVKNAQITAAGETGGLVRLGGEFQGGENNAGAVQLRENFVGRFGATEKLASAAALTVTESQIDAGTDGTLIAWSDGNTRIDGELTGKYVETSGKNLSVSSAPQSNGGAWLVDPNDVTISESSTNTTIPDGSADSFKASAIASYLDQGQGNDLFISATDSIEVLSNILYTKGRLGLSSYNIGITSGVAIGSSGYSTSSCLYIEASNQLTLGSANIYVGDDVHIRAKEMYMTNGAIRGQEISFRGEEININGGLIQATNHLSMWGTLDSSNTQGNGYDAVNQGFLSIMLNNATLKSGDGIEIYVDDLTLKNNNQIEANSIRVAGGRTGRPVNDTSCESSNYSCADGRYKTNKYTSSINFDGGKIVSNGGEIKLKVRNILVGSGYKGTLIIAESVRLDTDATITIPSGIETTPRIKTESIEFEHGSFVLGEYAIEAEEMSIGDQSVSLVGQGYSGSPHINHLKEILGQLGVTLLDREYSLNELLYKYTEATKKDYFSEVGRLYLSSLFYGNPYLYQDFSQTLDEMEDKSYLSNYAKQKADAALSDFSDLTLAEDRDYEVSLKEYMYALLRAVILEEEFLANKTSLDSGLQQIKDRDYAKWELMHGIMENIPNTNPVLDRHAKISIGDMAGAILNEAKDVALGSLGDAAKTLGYGTLAVKAAYSVDTMYNFLKVLSESGKDGSLIDWTDDVTNMLSDANGLADFMESDLSIASDATGLVASLRDLIDIGKATQSVTSTIKTDVWSNNVDEKTSSSLKKMMVTKLIAATVDVAAKIAQFIPEPNVKAGATAISGATTVVKDFDVTALTMKAEMDINKDNIYAIEKSWELSVVPMWNEAVKSIGKNTNPDTPINFVGTL
ncbi:MAG: filamentous hemagglutinin N-terminal domain-containing protein [Zoogloeaceae bacterium]|jgi:filamentous hemagglutinin family protein|nr:filamentous hemagglutinin N-terminal domain-containing protein [Zoogloeaceae bacterium]